MTNKKLSIVILKLESVQVLDNQLSNLQNFYKKLPLRYRKAISVVISDNGSNDETAIIVQNFSKQNKWLKAIFREKTLHYDEHLISIYQNVQSEFIWFCAIDDFIRNESCVIRVLDEISNNKNLSGIICGSSSNLLPKESNSVKKYIGLQQKLELILAEGKVSRHIIKRFELPYEELSVFSGTGYMHLTLQMMALKQNFEAELLKFTADFVRTTQKGKSFNNYHPKFACDVVLALRDSKMQELCPVFFLLHEKKVLPNRLKFLLKNIINKTIDCWHYDMMEDFVLTTFSQLRFEYFNPRIIFWSTVTISFLIFKPKLMKCALKGILYKRNKKEIPDYRFK